MPGTDKRKQSLYFPEDMLNEIQAEANRQDRSRSWVVQQGCRNEPGAIRRFPAVNDVIGGAAARPAEREQRGSAMASHTDNRKQSLYFPEEMLEEIQREANRQDRSLSWIVQQAWRLA